MVAEILAVVYPSSSTETADMTGGPGAAEAAVVKARLPIRVRPAIRASGMRPMRPRPLPGAAPPDDAYVNRFTLSPTPVLSCVPCCEMAPCHPDTAKICSYVTL